MCLPLKKAQNQQPAQDEHFPMPVSGSKASSEINLKVAIIKNTAAYPFGSGAGAGRRVPVISTSESGRSTRRRVVESAVLSSPSVHQAGATIILHQRAHDYVYGRK